MTVETEPAIRPAPPPSPPPEPVQFECVLCGGEANVAAVPCGHVCLCSNCQRAVEPINCWLCRAPVERLVRLYGQLRDAE